MCIFIFTETQNYLPGQYLGWADRYLRGVLQKSIQGRQEAEKKGQKVPNDLLQSLIKAHNSGEGSNDEESEEKPDSSNFSWNSKLSKSLSEEEVFAQSLLIIFAGFETTSTTLQMCYYMLAKHPDVQEKVYEEIESIVQSESPTYEELSQLTYMEQVINETLRLYPPAAIVARIAAETRTYGNITIPKGAGVIVPIFHVLKDPRYYPEPEKFDPEQFNEVNKTKRDPVTFLPFGYGPRLCIGMRLAYLELKIALVHSIRRIRFELNERTEPKKGESPKFRGHAILVEEKPILLSVSLRY
ncbi:hypothetical protein Btru_045783 [Bulinus truncatus]|nr:hypothetical protein Btru_045783 [Bulinus truncatus]